MSSAILGFGTATFLPGYGLAAKTPSSREAAALLRDAIGAGMRYVDTASAYGEAEGLIGLVANDIQDRGVRVCTKVSGLTRKATEIASEVRASLARLQLPSVDTLLLHSVDATAMGSSGVADELNEIRSAGLALRTGASTYGASDACVALTHSWCGALQVEHSILNPGVMSAIGTQSHLSEIVVRSVLCKGLLTPRRGHAGAIASELAPTLDSLERLAADWGWPLPELAIRFALDSPGVDVVIVGISTDAELQTAMTAAARPALDSAAMSTLAGFDRSRADAAHPERWDATATKAA